MKPNRSDELSRTYLKQIKEDSSYSSEEFAEKLGVSLSTLKTVEDDKKVISTEAMTKFFVKICDLVHISVYDLALWETDYQLKKMEIAKIKNESGENNNA